MKNIYIDRSEGKVVLSPSPLTFTIEVEDNFTASKVIEVQDGEIQETNDAGQLLYYIPNDDSDDNFTTESCTVTKTQPKEVTNAWLDDEGNMHYDTVTIQKPIEWVDNEPIMIENMVDKAVTFEENPTEFTAEEILEKKYQDLLDSTSYDYIQAGIFLHIEKIDLTDIQANSGVAILQLLPNGYAKTLPLELKDSVSKFELLEFNTNGVDIYVNDIKFDESKIINLDSPTNEIVIKFINTTDKYIDVNSYAIAY